MAVTRSRSAVTLALIQPLKEEDLKDTYLLYLFAYICQLTSNPFRYGEKLREA